MNSLRRFVPYYTLLAPYKLAFFGAVFFAVLYGAASGLGFPLVIKQNIPIIFSTAMNSVEAEVKGLNTGASDYITKPFNMALVQARVRIQSLSFLLPLVIV